MAPVVLAIDAGTTGVRTRAVYPDGRRAVSAYREFPQYFPRPGGVEHDADQIWEAVAATLAEVNAALGADTVAAIAITNQRETVVAWSRSSGRPRHRAVVWQDRRGARRCQDLAAAGWTDVVRRTTGLVLDPYFSATKFEWLLGPGGVGIDADLALGTIDSWILWNLTGGTVHATDTSNASRTLLYDLAARRWSEPLCELFGVPMSALPEVRPSSGRLGVTVAGLGLPSGIPISALAGDQQAALFGQACVHPGMAKSTFGTGSFVLLNVGPTPPDPVDGLLTTVAWTLGDGDTTYALEGSIFATGAAVTWLRDGWGLIDDPAEIGPLAAEVDHSNGMVVVPALTGLGSPWWDPYARATVIGISRGVTRAHVARAVVEAMAYQTRDVVDAMTQGADTALRALRIDGGAAVMDLLAQFQADLLGVPVHRPVDHETTAVGAAYLAGLAEGVWTDLDDIAAHWQLQAAFSPALDTSPAEAGYQQWRRAVDRSRQWAASDSGL